MTDIVFRNEEQINAIYSRVNSAVNEYNSIRSLLDTAHDGLDIKFNREYSSRLFLDGFSSFFNKISTDCQTYIESAPSFLRTNLKDFYKNHTQDVYTKIENTLNRVYRTFHQELIDKLSITVSMSEYFDINEDGSISRNEKLDQLIENRFTVSSDDEKIEIVQKMKELVEVEKKLKQLVGANYQQLLSTQQSDISHFDHEFKLIPLVDYLKKIRLL